MELTNYTGAIESLDSPEFAKSGYRVSLERNNSNIMVILFYKEQEVGRMAASFTKSGYRGERENRTFNEMLVAVRRMAVELYDDHNKNFKNEELLKALEDRLNGNTEMLVLTPGVEPEEDRYETRVWQGSYIR